MIGEQISMFDDRPGECCYNCKHFEKFEQPREYTNRDGKFGVFGVCLKSFNRNGSHSVYPIYIPDGKCKDFNKGSKCK